MIIGHATPLMMTWEMISTLDEDFHWFRPWSNEWYLEGMHCLFVQECKWMATLLCLSFIILVTFKRGNHHLHHHHHHHHHHHYHPTKLILWMNKAIVTITPKKILIPYLLIIHYTCRFHHLPRHIILSKLSQIFLMKEPAAHYQKIPLLRACHL